MADTGDIDQNIQRADGSRRLRAGGFAGNIQRKKFPADTFRLCAPVGFVAVGDPDHRSGLNKRFRNGRADAGSRAGDQRGFIFKLNTINPFCVGLE